MTTQPKCECKPGEPWETSPWCDPCAANIALTGMPLPTPEVMVTCPRCRSKMLRDETRQGFCPFCWPTMSKCVTGTLFVPDPPNTGGS